MPHNAHKSIGGSLEGVSACGSGEAQSVSDVDFSKCHVVVIWAVFVLKTTTKPDICDVRMSYCVVNHDEATFAARVVRCFEYKHRDGLCVDVAEEDPVYQNGQACSI